MGGAERTVYELYSRLVRDHGYTVFLVTINTEDAAKTEVLDGVHVYRVGRQMHNKYVKFFLLQWWVLIAYLKGRRSFSFDMIQVHYAFPASLAMFVLARLTGKPLVISEYHFGTGADIYSMDQNPSYVNRVCGWIYRRAAMILTISQDNKRFIHHVSGRDDVTVLKQGTDHTFFSPTYRDEKVRERLLGAADVLLVTTSRISPRKNLEEMITAVSLLKKRGYRAVLVINGKVDKGNAEYDSRLREQVEKLGLQDVVIFQGFVSDQDLRVIYASSDVFLLTSKYEGFGIANVEALGSGIPVVTYDTGAAGDFITQWENGYVVPENTPESLAESLSQILSDPERLHAMKKHARACVEKELNWARYASEHGELFQTLLNASV